MHKDTQFVLLETSIFLVKLFVQFAILFGLNKFLFVWQKTKVNIFLFIRLFLNVGLGSDEI